MIKNFVENKNIDQKRNILAKNRNLIEKLNWSILKILAKNKDFSQKSKYHRKTRLFVKSQKSEPYKLLHYLNRYILNRYVYDQKISSVLGRFR